MTSVEEAVVPASASDPLKLVDFLKELRERTWKDISSALSEYVWPWTCRSSTIAYVSLARNLNAIAERLRWPAPIAPAAYALATPEERTAFESSFINLLYLQAA